MMNDLSQNKQILIPDRQKVADKKRQTNRGRKKLADKMWQLKCDRQNMADKRRQPIKEVAKKIFK